MPIVVPPATTAPEQFVLDGLDLNDGVLNLTAVSAPPPRQRQEWIGAADSESQALVRDPLYENRKITASIVISPTAGIDSALDRIADIRDKLAAASQTPDGVALDWSPAGSARTVTFDVLTGEITDLPIDYESGWFANSPTVTIELTAKPYWRGTETLTSTASSSTPFVTLAVTGVTGDVPALGRLIVTDTAAQSRRHVEWGIEGQYYNASTSLLVDSDDMVTTGFAGSQATGTGAYDPNASGNNAIKLTAAAALAVALCGTGNLLHIGTFRVKARVWAGSLAHQFRLTWKAGDGPLSSNAWVTAPQTATWSEVDLGTIIVPSAVVGSQRWTGQVDVVGDTTGTDIYVDYLVLVPVAEGYGKARASYSYKPGVATGYDQFTGTTAAAALNARTAPAGGSWATSGSATDFAFADDLSGEQIKRATFSDTGPRWAILGSTNYTDTQVDVLAERGNSTSTTLEHGAIARWVDSSNYLRAVAQRDTFTGDTRTLSIVQRVAGVDTTLISAPISTNWAINTYYCIRLIVFASGRALAWVLDSSKTTILAVAEATSSVLATAGTLATGKPGLYDMSTRVQAVNRYYDDFQVSTPAAEPIAVYSSRNLQVRHDDTLRQDNAGTYSGRPPSYLGSRFLVPVGTSRVLVKAKRNDIEAASDANVTDALQIQVGWVPRGLAVPRS